MFGFLQRFSGQCLAFESGQLFLQSSQALVPGRSYPLQAELPVRQREGPLTISLRVKVVALLESTPLWVRRAETLFGQPQPRVYSASVESPPTALSYLEQLLEAQPRAQELRAKPRVEKRLRATSPQLPGFQGTVVDLSESGLGMLVSAPVERGRFLDFDIDFEEQGKGRLALRGKVCWCRQEDSGHRIGIEFQTLTQRQAWELRERMQVLLRAEESSLSDDRFLRG